MPETVTWSLEVSKETDNAVRWRVLDETVAETKAANAGVPPEEIEAAIDEALESVRAKRFRE